MQTSAALSISVVILAALTAAGAAVILAQLAKAPGQAAVDMTGSVSSPPSPPVQAQGPPALSFTQFRAQLQQGRLRAAHLSAVPKVLFRTGPFPLGSLPLEMHEALAHVQALSPALVQVYASDAECAQFVKREFPELDDVYTALVPGAYKSDVWRLLVLLRHGGVYSDVKHSYIQPVEALVDFESPRATLVQDFTYGKTPQGIYQAFVSAPPGHPLLWAMVHKVAANVRARLYGNTHWDITGPTAVAAAFRTRYGAASDSQPLVDVHRNSPLAQTEVHLLKLSGNDKHPVTFIADDHGEAAVLFRFPEYEALMQKVQSTSRYKALWRSRRVYAS